MNNEDLRWRVEAACRAAWPTPHEILRDGWVFRFGGGARRRTNAVSPLRNPRATIEQALSIAETFYGERALPVLFCIPNMASEVDDVLAACGYIQIAKTVTLLADLATGQTSPAHPSVALTETPSAAWFRAHSDLNGFAPVDMPAFRETVAAITDVVAFASIQHSGNIVAQAYGVVSNGLLVIEAVVTGTAHRRQGLANALVSALMGWAQERGATASCLQVLADNTPALALYRGLGFERELYRYHYRAQPGSRWSEDST